MLNSILRYIIIYIILVTNAVSNNIQIKMVTKITADIPVIGKVNSLRTMYLTSNSKNTVETTSIERKFFGFIAGLFSDIKDTTGTLVDDEGLEWKYNINDKEYWKSDDESNEASEKDNESKKNEFTFSLGADDESEEDSKFISINRFSHGQMENINGFKAKKWTTTMEFSKFIVAIDEWSVKDLALLRHADSLNKRVLISQGLSDTLIALTTYGRGLSNNEMILGTTKLDSLYDANNISPILGEIIKGIVRKTDKGEDEYDMSFGLEMVELYAEDYIPEKFMIPKDFKLID